MLNKQTFAKNLDLFSEQTAAASLMMWHDNLLGRRTGR
jgi:hypothetical protein